MFTSGKYKELLKLMKKRKHNGKMGNVINPELDIKGYIKHY